MIVSFAIGRLDKPSTETWQVGIGQQGKLDSGSEYTAILDSKESFQEWLNCEIAGDHLGKVELASSGRARLVRSGANVLVIDWGNVMAIPISKVRILDGEHMGAAGWGAAKQIKK